MASPVNGSEDGADVGIMVTIPRHFTPPATAWWAD